ncbi:MAG: PaaI family thioesterase [Nitrospiraceae bacterium]|nr:MAG: PaaI family thioesterase [Nitrospiraceae bacterium]
MKKLSLEDNGYCFVCGSKNPHGLHLVFRSQDGKISAEFVPQKSCQGFKDLVHGGIISCVLDEAMMKAVLSQGMEAVTVELIVRLQNPLYVGNRALIEAEIKKTGNRLIETAARIRKEGGTVVAEAKAKLLRYV